MYKYELGKSINANNAAEFEEDLFAAYKEHGELKLDATNLEYISSAGLRVLLKLRKEQENLEINHVSNDVYAILEVTGFTDLLVVKKQLREISVEGCKILGKGGSGTVYRLSEDTIVKVFNPDMDYETIDLERAYARNAFVAGIPTAISFDIVKVGDCLGAVYESMNSDTLSNAFNSHPEKFEEYMDKYVALYKKLSSTEGKEFENIKELSKIRIEHLKGFFEEQDLDILRKCVDAMPDSNTLVHGDFHPGNIMLQDDELMLIDMADLTTGPKTYDLLTLFRDIYVTAHGNEHGQEYLRTSVNISPEMADRIFFGFMNRMFDNNEEKIKEMIDKYYLMYFVNSMVAIGGCSDETIQKRSPLFGSFVERLRKYQDVLPGLFSQL